MELTSKIALAGLLFLTVGLGFSRLTDRWPDQIETNYHRDPYRNLILEAKAAIVYDPESHQVLFAKQPHLILPLASITKVMTALVASDLSAEQSFIAISNEALRAEGDSGLHRDEVWSISRLIDFTLVSSSNDGAVALAAVAGSQDRFVNLMNNKSAELGLTDTHFYNPTGLDQNNLEAGAYGSALDVARLFAYILKNHPGLLAATSQSALTVVSANDLVHVARNTNNLSGSWPGLIAGKTGYTDAAGGNLALAADLGLNQPVIAVVLGSSEPGRFADMEKLLSVAAGDPRLFKK